LCPFLTHQSCWFRIGPTCGVLRRTY
jgi:hypothetical protein